MAEQKNYITPEGYAALEKEFQYLIKVDRPEVVRVVSWAAGNGDRSENGDYIYGKKRLRQIDGRIVGQDELDPTQGYISWVSPMAKALLAKNLGDTIRVVTPVAETEYEIIDIRYE